MDPFDAKVMIKSPQPSINFTIDGINYHRGGPYSDSLVQHEPHNLRCWKIIDDSLQTIPNSRIHEFYDFESYIVEWTVITRTHQLKNSIKNQIYFHWKGENASKGYSPLPPEVNQDNPPPVERIVQWSEPPVFLRLFDGKFVVNLGKSEDVSNEKKPHLYILRGEEDNELHLIEIPVAKKNLRSRTSFLLFTPSYGNERDNKKNIIIWHGSCSNLQSKTSIKIIANKICTNCKITELNEDVSGENEQFLQLFPHEENDYFKPPIKELFEKTPRLFYFNNITGKYVATEIYCSHSSSLDTPFPFLQSHLYTATQPGQYKIFEFEIWAC